MTNEFGLLCKSISINNLYQPKETKILFTSMLFKSNCQKMKRQYNSVKLSSCQVHSSNEC